MIDLVSYFAERQGIILDMVRQMVEVESPSLDKQAVDLMAELMVNLAEQAGGRVTLERREERGNHVVARWGGKGRGLLVLSHIDTVFPVGTLAERPWRVEGNEAYGPGAYDTKSGAAITLSALSGSADRCDSEDPNALAPYLECTIRRPPPVPLPELLAPWRPLSR